MCRKVCYKNKGLFNDLEDLSFRYDNRLGVKDGSRTVYAIEFSNGISKVGVTKQPVERVKSIANRVRLMGMKVGRIYLSGHTKNCYSIERETLNKLERVNDTEYVKNTFENCVKEIIRSMK